MNLSTETFAGDFPIRPSESFGVVHSDLSLKLHCGIHIFKSFLFAWSNGIEQLKGHTTVIDRSLPLKKFVRLGIEKTPRYVFKYKLHNTLIDEIVTKLSSFGLLDRNLAFLSLVSVLSISQKLPSVDVLVRYETIPRYKLSTASANKVI